ncbi:MAG TPA: hypothetical protein VH518_04685 [Tepidisphaeraceae bacterium]
MLFLQIRQAEVAVADGRLDEAYQLLQQSPALRSHRRGQTLITELVEKLVERAHEHLEGSRWMQALGDCEKAQQFGGNRSDVLELRAEIEGKIVENDRDRRQGAHAGAIQTAAALVDSALGRNDVDRAVLELIRAQGNGCTDHRLRELDGNVRTMLGDQIEMALNEGRFDQADALIDRLGRLDPEGMATRRFSRAVEQAHAAWKAIESGRPSDAREALHRLAAQLPAAKWVKEVLAHVTAAEQSLAAVRGGPMGLLAMSEPPQRTTGFQPVRAKNGHGLETRATESLPSKFIIQVDGAGSFLVLTKSHVTLGPISSPQMPDIALIAEAGGNVASIERIEDDYFLSGKLLNSGDRIIVSPRCRMQFTLPNPSSTTAVLDLTSGRFPRSDLRRVVLLDRDLIIGPGSSAHVRADHLTEPLVLQVRNGQMSCGGQQINVGAPVQIRGASFVVTMG